MREIYCHPFVYPGCHPCYRNQLMNQWTPNTPAYPVLNHISLQDHGAQPFVVNINEAAKKNHTFRTALWTGPYLQVTLMSIAAGDEVGLEIHPDNDQFFRIEQGQGIVRWGENEHYFNNERVVTDGSAIMIPAGTWHNIINTGPIPLKLFSIYAPPHHAHGTIHRTRAEAIAAEENEH